MRNVLAPLALCALCASAAAQTRQAPNLVFTISGGLTTGAALWAVERQPVVGGAGAQDTLALARRLRPGVTASLGATLFRSPHFGIMAEIGYFGLASESRCRNAAPYQPDPDRIVEQACVSAQGAHIPTSAVGFQAGAVFRLAPGRRISPYARATGGFALLASSFVLTTGTYRTGCRVLGGVCTRVLLNDSSARELTTIATLAAGITIATSPGSRVRIELRDLMAWVPVAAGTGNAPFLEAPQRWQLKHVPTLTAGIDIVLERRRPRRY
jgi:hypothetical protein